MVPARNLHRRHCDAYGASASGACSYDTARRPPQRPPRVTRAPMAQEPLHPLHHDQEPPKHPEVHDQEEQDEARHEAQGGRQEVAGTSGSSSHHGGGGGDWLQLGLGPSRPAPPPRWRGGMLQPPPPPPAAASAELELFTGRPQQAALLRPATAGIPPAPMPRAGPPWLPPPWPPAPPPRAFYAGSWCGGGGGGPAQVGASVADTIRVVWPPPAPALRPRGAAAGIWFVLQAAPNQGREPFLPQIPRSYLRIKDGRVTIRLLIKYLVTKLGLEHESEVEITCRGRPLHPFLTLQHVRDSIWFQTDSDAVPAAAAAAAATAAHHVMTLQYGRRT